MDSTEATEGMEGSENESPVVKALRKQLKDESAARAAAESQLGVFSRDKAFDDAGIPKDGPATFFRKAYDGELTPDAIQAAAVEGQILNVNQPPQQQSAPTGPSPEELAAIARTAAATTNPAPQTPTDLNSMIREAGKDGLGDKDAVLEAFAEMGALPEDF